MDSQLGVFQAISDIPYRLKLFDADAGEHLNVVYINSEGYDVILAKAALVKSHEYDLRLVNLLQDL